MQPPELPLYSPDPTLTPDQHHVLALLAEGRSISEAAAEVGVHRNTIGNWRRAVPAFAREIEYATREQALVWHEEAIRLAPRASQVLEETLNNPEASPALRLRAALAILKMAADPQPRPLRAFPTAAAEKEAAHGERLVLQSALRRTNVHNAVPIPAQLCTTVPTPATLRKAPEPGRNSLCPCGSGQKYKRCCVHKSAQSLAA
jgi:SEC-C motif/Homeodomain-like domain